MTIYKDMDINQRNQILHRRYSLLGIPEKSDYNGNLLYYDFLSKHRIISILQFNINFHTGKNLALARKKWAEDIRFV